MDTDIGYCIEPYSHLAIDIAQIGKGSKGPEVLAKISDEIFDLPLFIRGSDIAGSRDDLERSQKIQEGLIKSNE